MKPTTLGLLVILTLSMARSIAGLLVMLTPGLLVAPLASPAALPAKVPKIGWLASGFPPSEAARQRSPFFQGLRELGWVEGQNVTIALRYAEERDDRLPALAAELVQLGVDVLVAGDSHVISAAKQATSTIPIVMTVSGDPVRGGYVVSLARPGGNLTGLTNITAQLAGKRLELLREVVPGVSRVAVLGPFGHADWPELAGATQALGVQLLALKVHRPEEFGRALETAARERAEALIVLPAPTTNPYRRRLVDLAAQHRLPAMYALKEYVQVGGLMAYGPSIPDLYRRAATYVDKILKGTKPADPPVEQPMRFELVINLTAAQALGLTIPPTLLFPADEVIR
jgi:putative tryptophan/tyrosine transport system substrate-binding protein